VSPSSAGGASALIALICVEAEKMLWLRIAGSAAEGGLQTCHEKLLVPTEPNTARRVE
jgi:hypothetical protein